MAIANTTRPRRKGNRSRKKTTRTTTRTSAKKPTPPRDRRHATELSGIRHKLKIAQSCARVVGAALRDQNCELDSNAADVLDTHVTDALHIQILKVDRLLGHDVNEDDIEEDEG